MTLRQEQIYSVRVQPTGFFTSKLEPEAMYTFANLSFLIFTLTKHTNKHTRFALKHNFLYSFSVASVNVICNVYLKIKGNVKRKMSLLKVED